MGVILGFPSRSLSVDPRAGVLRRHHISASTIQRQVKKALRRAGIAKDASVHLQPCERMTGRSLTVMGIFFCLASPVIRPQILFFFLRVFAALREDACGRQSGGWVRSVNLHGILLQGIPGGLVNVGNASFEEGEPFELFFDYLQPSGAHEFSGCAAALGKQ